MNLHDLKLWPGLMTGNPWSPGFTGAQSNSRKGRRHQEQEGCLGGGGGGDVEIWRGGRIEIT